MAEWQQFDWADPNHPEDSISLDAHLIYEPEAHVEGFITFVDEDGNMRHDGFTQILTQESSDVYGPQKRLGLNKYMHALLDSMFQVHFGTPPLTDYPDPQINVTGGALIIGGTPA